MGFQRGPFKLIKLFTFLQEIQPRNYLFYVLERSEIRVSDEWLHRLCIRGSLERIVHVFKDIRGFRN